MSRLAVRSAAVLFGLASWTPVALAAAKGDELGSYLADIGGGPVAAHEILGLPAGAVTQLQSPKDVVVAIDKANGEAGKEGFGVAISPARIGNSPLALGIASYSTNSWLRAWGGTSFSYAQRSKEYDAVSYKENAVAVHVNYYLDAEDDPVVAARRAFVDCAPRVALNDEFTQEVLARFEARRLVSSMSESDIEALKKEIRGDVLFDKFKASGAAAVKCVRDGYASAKAKWNASQMGITLGKGWIRGPTGGLARTSLAEHAAVTVGYSTKRMPDSLFNVTLRRVSHEVDTSTLAGTPTFKSSSLVAARYTYGHGDNQDTFLLAEISNAKESKLTEANATFKHALGLDRKIADGIWIEFRLGRSRVTNGDGLETKALLNLKISPTPGIPKLLAGGS